MDLEQTDVADETTQDDQEIADELLIEEISIDGMCGVY
jgi:mycofactocin precursor